METIAKRIQNSIPLLKERIIDTDILLDELNLPKTKKQAALKELSRLEGMHELTRLTKGVYAKAEISKITKKNKPVSEADIIRYYTKENNGFTIGYDLYNRKNVSTQVSKKKTVFSSVLKKETRNIKSITVKKVSIDLTPKKREFIEVLEIIENSNRIQDFNETGFYNFMKEFVETYDRNTMTDILNSLNYKKQTIYNLHKIISAFGKESGLENHLNATSHYKENKAYEVISSR